MLSDAVSGLKVIAEIVNQVTSAVDVGPPGLKTGLTGLIYVLDAIQVGDHADIDSPMFLGAHHST